MASSQIRTKDIWNQLRFDLIGKDSQRGITLTYGWLANQFGHFALGFIPTILFYNLYTSYVECSTPLLWSCLSTAILWTAFEAYNFLGPLIAPSKTNPFKPAWLNVGFDTASDLVFFYTGSLAASLLFSPGNIYIVVFFTLTLSTFFIFAYWYPLKMYTQYAYFPFQTRLSQWNYPIHKDAIRTIHNYLSSSTPTHILLFGNENSGKTSLAVAMGTEKTIHKNSCYYTTGIKLLQLFQESDTENKQRSLLPWSWRQTQYLIVDDINAGNNLPNIITPNMIEQALITPKYKDANLTYCKHSSIIWVIGNSNEQEKWEHFLTSLGISDMICLHIS